MKKGEDLAARKHHSATGNGKSAIVKLMEVRDGLESIIGSICSLRTSDRWTLPRASKKQ